MKTYIIFTPDGIPGWFGPEPVQGSEPLNLEELRHLLPADALEDPLAASWQHILTTHRRVAGVWSLRTPVEVIAPTAEAEREAAFQAALAARDAAIVAAVTASDAYRSFILGGMTLTAYRADASDIEAQFPMPVH